MTTLPRFLTPRVFSRFSKKLGSRIENPRSAGYFQESAAEHHEMRLVIGNAERKERGVVRVRFYLMIDENDGVIADAKFQAFGPAALIGAADAACDLLVRKSYVQAQRITADLIDIHLRDKSDEHAFPPETSSLLNLVLDAIENATEQCIDIPYHDVYVAPPTTSTAPTTVPDWDNLSLRDQIAIVEDVIAADIRPYIELDEGGVEVADIVNSREIHIIYQGSCTSCYSATGATLNAIQQILRTKVHPLLTVIPDPRSLNLNS